jgi:dihydrofolate reductase
MDWLDRTAGGNAMAHEIRRGTGAILGGRRWYDVASERYDGVAGIYGGAWSGPVFVLTHREPPEDPAVTFLGGPFEDAVTTARRAAGDGHLELFGADLARQALGAGLLDEIIVHIAPVLLGDGVRLYGAPGAPRVALERTALAASGPVVDVRFRVAD